MSRPQVTLKRRNLKQIMSALFVNVDFIAVHVGNAQMTLAFRSAHVGAVGHQVMRLFQIDFSTLPLANGFRQGADGR